MKPRPSWGGLLMTDQQVVAARAAGEDVLGRRGFFANVDRARAFGSSSLSGLLDIFGGTVLVGVVVIVVVYLMRAPDLDDTWLPASLIAMVGLTCGLLLLAVSRVVTYAKACAVLLAMTSNDNS